MDPLAEHINPVKSVSKQIDIAVDPVQAAPKHTLSDLSREFRFFTVGVLYAAIPKLHRDLVKDFIASMPELAASSGIGMFSSQGSSFFSGLGTHLVHNQYLDMDRVLYAVRNDAWEDCRAFIGGARFIDPATCNMHRILLYKIPVVDRVRLAKPGIITELPTVPVTVFAVTSDTQFSYLTAATYPAVPTLTVGPPKTVEELAMMEML